MTGNVPSTTPAATQNAAPASPTLSQRIIVLTIQIAGGSTLTLGSTTDANLCPRCSVHVEMAPTPHPGNAVVVVYGLTLDHINQLTVAGLLYYDRVGKNKIQVQAGDTTNGVTTVYTGTILLAYPKASQPEMAFVMVVFPTQDLQLLPVPPTSFKGAIDGAAVLKQIAQQGNVTIENNSNVSAVLSNPYFPNVTWEQLKACAEAMGCSATYDPVKKVFAVWPKKGNRGGTNQKVSPAMGMIDYPEFQAVQVKVRVIFDPSNVYAVGQPITIEGSQFAAANGRWVVSGVTLDLAAQMPDGPWEVAITGNRQDGGTA